MKFPKSLPSAHRAQLEQIVSVLSQDPRFCGIGCSGSYASDTMDQYSDLDFVIAIEPKYYQEVMAQRFDILSQFDDMLAAFTGEHVGEPRLIVSVFGELELVHVDFKFVSLPDAAVRVDDTQVLWEKDSMLSDVFATAKPSYPQPDPQWIEDRIWIWTHYAATKIARGEYFETLEFLSFLRFHALSPLALKQAGLTPSGVRTIEKRLPEFAKKLEKTVALPEKESLKSALEHCVLIYLELRANETIEVNDRAKLACVDYLKNIN
ncbi:nucleotidyltransferase domain-containing protein [Vibrio sp. La 4.2.2]|uniref:nucleotidyltransferase domain-containing protein n=1 Tax=Vibrio sp. La 4.2.2 TaxID=2998830 RepID=UPI0022CE2FB4|nr:nucleotidyltransferase domain-containing protein [Vibrio sp. La 4.2.2]MDA0106868.1 nucleotidyltransferase domain-containing protein [Vibrio sp. La 4.2.2]